MADKIPELTVSNLMRGFFASSYLGFLTGISFLHTVSFVCFAGGIALGVYKFTRPFDERNVPPRGPVPAGKTRISIAGYNTSPPTAKAHYLAALIAQKYPDQYETWYYWDYATQFGTFVKNLTDPLKFKELGCDHLIGYDFSPFCFFETGNDKKCKPVGGSDHLSEWALKEFSDDKEICDLARQTPGLDWVVTGKAFHTGVGRPTATYK